jgi:hypothetical protein
MNAADVATRLIDAALTAPSDSGQSLAKGAAGVALLHVERALAGSGTWRQARAWIRLATCGEITAADNAGLYVGAPAISFLLHMANADSVLRFTDDLNDLDAEVADLTHRRVDAALARLDRAEPPNFAEYDLFHGLTGIGRLLLEHDPGNDALGHILTYLVRLTQPRQGADKMLPGWWVDHDPDPLLPTPGGHANLGIAHGITGPLALLATALRHGVAIDGQVEAIGEICMYLDTWQQDGETGPWWPQWITLNELRSGRVDQPGPLRPSWCYGTPGIARAQQMAAIAIGDGLRQLRAEHALAACLSDTGQLSRLTDPGLCHGWAGVYMTTWQAATDALTPVVGACLPGLASRLDQAACDDVGLLTGAAGVALVLLTVSSAAAPISGWDACLLIN